IFDDPAKLRRHIKVDGKFTRKPDKFDACRSEFRLESAARGRDQRHVKPKARGISANVEHLRFGTAAAERIEMYQDLHRVGRASEAASNMTNTAFCAFIFF